MISPVRPRANASGLTRIRDFSVAIGLSVCQRRRRREVSPVAASAGSALERLSAATVGWSVVWRRRRREDVADADGALVSASQNGQMRQAGSIGFEHE